MGTQPSDDEHRKFPPHTAEKSDGEGVLDGESAVDCEMDRLGVGDSDGDLVRDGVGLGVWVGDRDGDGDRDGVNDVEGLSNPA